MQGAVPAALGPGLSSAWFAGKGGYSSIGERSLLQKQTQRAGEFSGEATESSFRDLIGGLEQSVMATEGVVRGRRCSASSGGFLLPEWGGQQFLAPAQGEGRDVNRMKPRQS